MTEETSIYSTLRHVAKTMLEADCVPLNGGLPPFDWEQFNQTLQKEFELKDLTLSPKAPEWIDQGDVLPLVNNDLIISSIKLPPIEGDCWWLSSKGDLAALMAYLTEIPEMTQSESLQNAFHQFFRLKVLHSVLGTLPQGEFSPQFVEERPPFTQQMLQVEVCFTLATRTYHSRLLFSDLLVKNWNAHFMAKQPPSINELTASDASVNVGLEVGKVGLTLDAWQAVNEGDFIPLDQCFIDPVQNKGFVTLTLAGLPIHHGRLKKDGAVKLLENPSHL